MKMIERFRLRQLFCFRDALREGVVSENGK